MDHEHNMLLIPFGLGRVQAEKVLKIYLDEGFDAALLEDAGQMYLKVYYPMHRVIDVMDADKGVYLV